MHNTIQVIQDHIQDQHWCDLAPCIVYNLNMLKVLLMNTLTAGAAYIWVYQHNNMIKMIKYHIWKLLKIKSAISNIWKQLTSISSNLNNFHSLEVVDRVSETQFQVGENWDE